jgi:fructose-1,6-bisphosphatase/inositol monophosphatase family enzyme
MSYQAELDFAKDLARQAGKINRKYFQIGVETTTKSDHTPVTRADTEINQLVIDEIAKKFPQHSVLGEEASNLHAGAEYTWVCDPIDGTIPYSIGLATNVFSLILTRKGVPVTGVVFDPHLDRLFWATKGEGAFVGNTRLKVNKLKLAEGIIGMSGRQSAVVDSPKFHMYIEQKAHRVMALSCCIYEGMLVTAGQLTAHVYPGLHAHDAVASKLFVEEAGGIVTDLYGNDQKYDEPVHGIIARNGVVQEELLAIARRSLLAT